RMVGAVYFGTLIPLLFLVVVIRGEYRKLILFFAWGLTSAIIIYGINILIDTYFVLNETLFLSQLIPLMEEFLKIIPVFFLIKKKGKVYRYNIVRFAMASGIGFSILENYLYLSISASSGMGGSVVFIITRSLTASLMHGSTTALIGYAIQIMHNYNFFSFFLSLGMYLLAVSIHSIYNLLGLTKGLQVIAILIPVFLFMLEYYLFNFFGRKGVGQKGLKIPVETEMKGSTK
ncbi:MAG: PrsW family intramembrane metalloprotease, partial [Spirochaetes bacterium]|nr:PrsW family intramembrane metalloprotease [Spirochaetota bacterium]